MCLREETITTYLSPISSLQSRVNHLPSPSLERGYPSFGSHASTHLRHPIARPLRRTTICGVVVRGRLGLVATESPSPTISSYGSAFMKLICSVMTSLRFVRDSPEILFLPVSSPSRIQVCLSGWPFGEFHKCLSSHAATQYCQVICSLLSPSPYPLDSATELRCSGLFALQLLFFLSHVLRSFLLFISSSSHSANIITYASPPND